MGNTIANAAVGVTVVGGGTGDTIRGNSIFGETSLGIDLGGDGVTQNGSHAPGTPGPNNWQTFPVLSAAYAVSGSTVVVGTLSSTPCSTFTIDFYANPVQGPFGFGKAGPTWARLP
jgi:hypothetical protein